MERYRDYRSQFIEAGEGIVTHAPTHLDIELASVCNFRCPMCPQAETFVDWKKGFMPTDLALRLLDEAKEIGVLSIKLNWRGEATLHPDFPAIVQYASGLDFVDMMINTNGAYTNSKVRQAMSLFDTVIFSIDTLDPVRAERLRPGKPLSVVLDNLEYVISKKHVNKSQPGERLNIQSKIIRVNFTLQKENWDEQEAIKEYAEKHGVEIYIKPVFPRNTPKAGQYFPEEKFNVIGRKNCGFPFQRLVIAHDGRVAPCCVPWNDTLFVGDVNKQSLLEIWNGAELAAIRDAALKAEYKHLTCVGCTSWASYEVSIK